ncbi:hypothetical protein [Azospirillum sp.]|uniref:hypothetical protein n=1 Tax=Azospirillum sp. TaxID=34012 RepID=UPI003D708207
MAVPKGKVPKPGAGGAQVPAHDPAADFIAAAPGKSAYPWQAPYLRDDVRKQLNVDMPEKLLAKVEWLVKQLDTSKRLLVERALEELVEREFRERGIE